MIEESIQACAHETAANLGKEVEVLPGIWERRYFLRSSVTSVAAALVLGATRARISAQEPPPRAAPTISADKLAWDDFLKESVPVAQKLFADPTFSIDEYLYRIGSLATRIREIPETQLFPYTAVSGRVFFAPSFRGSPFFIIQWRLEPGAVLPPHNHPNASVCTVGYEGEVRLRNFEIVGAAPEYEVKRTFQVQETHNETMTRGRINTLSSSRDNIHFFQAGKMGARGIDITTLHGKMAQFSFLEIAERPVDAEKRIFEATWSDVGRKAESRTEKGARV